MISNLEVSRRTPSFQVMSAYLSVCLASVGVPKKAINVYLCSVSLSLFESVHIYIYVCNTFLCRRNRSGATHRLSILGLLWKKALASYPQSQGGSIPHEHAGTKNNSPVLIFNKKSIVVHTNEVTYLPLSGYITVRRFHSRKWCNRSCSWHSGEFQVEGFNNSAFLILYWINQMN